MLKRKRDPDPTEEQSSSQRKNPRRTGFLKGKQVSVYWAPSDIWAPAIIDKQVRTGIIVKWLSDDTTTLILDAFVDAVIHKRIIPEPAPKPAAAPNTPKDDSGAGTTKYPRRERVKTKRTDSRIGLSCKEYNMKFAKDDSWAKKQVLKERANEKVRGVTPVRRSTRVAGAIKEKTPAHIREEMENMLSM